MQLPAPLAVIEAVACDTGAAVYRFSTTILNDRL